MARNGSGDYSLPAGNPVSTGTTISSTWANNTLSDIASALTQSISKDGQTTYTGNQPMGGNRHTNVGNATARNEYATLGQVQDSAAQYLTSVSGTNTITASLTGLAAYVTGLTFRFVPANTNTGAVTLNVNGLGAIAVTKQGNTALVAGDIVSGQAVEVLYDGTQFQMLSAPRTMAFAALSVSGTATLTTVTASGSITQTISSGGDFAVLGSTAAGAESALRLNTSDGASGIALKLSNSNLNKQATMRGRSDGGITFYVNQASAGASTSGTQAADIDASGFFNAVRVSENATRTFSRNSAGTPAGQNYTAANAVYTFAHGLGQVPVAFTAWARCIDASANTTGNAYPLNHVIYLTNNNSSSAANVTADATNVYIRVAGNIAVSDIVTPSSIVSLVAGTKWELNVRAWY